MEITGLFKTTGQKLIDSFGLSKLGKMSIVIQKVISSSKNIYVITYDSRYKDRIMTFNDIRKIQGNNIYDIRVFPDKTDNKPLKLTVPLYLYKYNKKIPSNSYVITRDLMGRERLRNNNLIESYQYTEKGDLIKL